MSGTHSNFFFIIYYEYLYFYFTPIFPDIKPFPALDNKNTRKKLFILLIYLIKINLKK